MIGYAVVAHASRIEAATALATTLAPCHVALDDGTRGAYGNHVAAIRAALADPDVTHACIIEDDARPVTDLRPAVDAAVTLRPDQTIGLYLGTGRSVNHVTPEMIAEGEATGWIEYSRYLHGVGTIWPRRIGEAITAAVYDGPLYDTPVAHLLMRMRETVAYTWPSLVDHADTKPVIDRRHRLGRRTIPARRAFKVGRPTWARGGG